MAETAPTHHSIPSDHQSLVARLKAVSFLPERDLSEYPTGVLRATLEALESWLDPAMVPVFLRRAQARGAAATPPGPRPQAAQRAEEARPPGGAAGGSGPTEGGISARRAATATRSQAPSLPTAVRDNATDSTVPTVCPAETVGTVESVEKDDLIKVPPFPVAALPESLRTYCQSVAEALPCPVDYPATFMLSVVGACIGLRCCIQPSEGWTEWPLLWTCVVGRSGDRKTAALAKTTAPLDLIEQALPERKQICINTCTIPSLRDALRENPEGMVIGTGMEGRLPVMDEVATFPARFAAGGHRNGSGRPFLYEAWPVYTSLPWPGRTARAPCLSAKTSQRPPLTPCRHHPNALRHPTRTVAENRLDTGGYRVRFGRSDCEQKVL
jgi:hypothetical protein